jgi:hypothetical protein
MAALQLQADYERQREQAEEAAEVRKAEQLKRLAASRQADAEERQLRREAEAAEAEAQRQAVMAQRAEQTQVPPRTGTAALLYGLGPG